MENVKGYCHKSMYLRKPMDKYHRLFMWELADSQPATGRNQLLAACLVKQALTTQK